MTKKRDWRTLPRKPIKKTRMLGIRVTENEYAEIHHRAKESGVSMAELVMSVLHEKWSSIR